MIKLLDHFVADWHYYLWNCEGVPVKQVMVHLFNGMTFIMDEDDFLSLSDYEAM